MANEIVEGIVWMCSWVGAIAAAIAFAFGMLWGAWFLAVKATVYVYEYFHLWGPWLALQRHSRLVGSYVAQELSAGRGDRLIGFWGDFTDEKWEVTRANLIAFMEWSDPEDSLQWRQHTESLSHSKAKAKGRREVEH